MVCREICQKEEDIIPVFSILEMVMINRKMCQKGKYILDIAREEKNGKEPTA